MTRFEDLEVWPRGVRLAVDIFSALRTTTDYPLSNQLEKSALSIPSNVAEGFERQLNKEFIRFLYISMGSCAELRTQLIVSLEAGILEEARAKDLIERTRELSAMLYGLIETRKSRF